MKKLDYITVLRAIAILGVLIVHVSLQSINIEKIHPYIIAIINNGARGVQLFYLLSAFTLFLSFSNRVNEKKTVRNYFIRRFFRIAPLYYIAIVYYLWQDGFGPRYWLGNDPSISLGNIISNFTFTHGFSPYWIASLVPGGWSVAIEVAFYCLVPFLYYRIKNIQQAYNFLLVTLAIRFILLLIFQHIILIPENRLWNEYLFLYFPNQLPIFALGIILYFLIYSETYEINLKSLLLGAIFLLVGFSLEQQLLIYNLFLFGLSFILLVIALQKYHPKILFNQAFLYIGKVSYTLYLTHWAAIYFLNKFRLINFFEKVNEPFAIINLIINYLIVLSISLFFSCILNYFIEEPLQKFGKKIINHTSEKIC
ncbi:acyltransferase [Inquilinus sp. KBS0705]|nr:acyltransferase [Inquilinus sp. KBS0705]